MITNPYPKLFAHLNPSPTAMPSVEAPLEPFAAIRAELERASVWPPFNSLHEARGVIEEEFDEFWDHVKVNQKRRDLIGCRSELVQLAAMAIKGIECIDIGRGRV
jgi:ParB-like chromosome segregation protein Spo0J